MQEYIDGFVASWSTPLGIVAQILSLIGMVFNVISFQVKHKRTLLIIQMIAMVFFTANLFMMNPPAIVGALANLVTITRNLYLRFSKKRIPWTKYVVMVLYASTYALLFSVPLFTNWSFGQQGGPNAADYIISLFPIIANIANTFGVYQKKTKEHKKYNNKKVVIFNLCFWPFWFVYNIYFKTLGGMLSDLICGVSMVVGLIRIIQQQKKDKALGVSEIYNVEEKTNEIETNEKDNNDNKK